MEGDCLAAKVATFEIEWADFPVLFQITFKDLFSTLIGAEYLLWEIFIDVIYRVFVLNPLASLLTNYENFVEGLALSLQELPRVQSLLAVWATHRILRGSGLHASLAKDLIAVDASLWLVGGRLANDASEVFRLVKIWIELE